MNDSLIKHIADSLNHIHGSNVTSQDSLVNLPLSKYVTNKEQIWNESWFTLLVDLALGWIATSLASFRREKKEKLVRQESNKQKELDEIIIIATNLSSLNILLHEYMTQLFVNSFKYDYWSGYDLKN